MPVVSPQSTIYRPPALGSSKVLLKYSLVDPTLTCESVFLEWCSGMSSFTSTTGHDDHYNH